MPARKPKKPPAKKSRKDILVTASGLPPELTPAKIAALEQHLLKGIFREDAATLEGLDARKLRTWMATGRALPDGPFGELARRLDAARAKYDADSDEVLAKHPDWRAVAWHKERLNPKRNHLPTKLVFDDGLEAMVDALEHGVREVLVDGVKVDAELRAKLLARVAALAAGDEDAGSGMGGADAG